MKKFLSAFMAIIMILLISSCDNSVSEVITPKKFKNVTFNGSTILDNEICYFRADKIEPNADEGYTLNIAFKNKTNNKNLMFSLSRVSVNGFMCDPYWGYKTYPGEEGFDTVVWSHESFELNSITDPTDIELTLRIYDFDDMGKKDYFTEQFVIFPNGQENDVPYQRIVDLNDTVLFDSEKGAMFVKGYQYTKTSGFSINALIENKTDKNLIYTLEKATINETTVIPYWSCEISAGKNANVTINWTAKQLSEEEEEVGDEITDVELILKAIDIETGKDVLNQNFIVSPQLKMQNK